MSMRDLLKSSLRLSPDHIIVGEVRGSDVGGSGTGRPDDGLIGQEEANEGVLAANEIAVGIRGDALVHHRRAQLRRELRGVTRGQGGGRCLHRRRRSENDEEAPHDRGPDEQA